MSAELDNQYRAQRLRLRATVLAQIARIWATAQPQSRDAFIAAVLPVVHAGQAVVVRLVDAFFATKTIDATGAGRVKGLDPAAYTVEAIRNQPAAVVYDRPFGALGYALATGADFAVARAAGGAALEKLASTDLQLAQTYAARDWMSDEPQIVGYQRITSGGCPLCTAAAGRTYRSEDLAPIHEGCRCDVAPVYGDVTHEHLPSGLVAVSDPELGSRLADDTWKVAA